MDGMDPSNFQRAPTMKAAQPGGDLRIDTYLTNFSMRWRQEASQFVSPKASTPVPVLHESDKFAIYPRGYFWRDEAEIRPLGGRPIQVSYKVESDNYLAQEWALEHTIDDRRRRNTEAPFDLDEAGVSLLEGKQMIRQDRIWATTVFAAGVWAHDYTGGVDFALLDDAGTDPVVTFNRLKRILGKGSGFKPNTLVLGANVLDGLTVHPSLTERIKYTQRAVIDIDLLASLLSIPNVMVAESMYNAANEGHDDDFEYIVDENSMWLGYIEPAARMDAPTAIARFAWTGLIPGATNQIGGVITRGRDGRAYSDWIHSRNAYDIKRVATDLGIYMTGAVGGAISA